MFLKLTTKCENVIARRAAWSHSSVMEVTPLLRLCRNTLYESILYTLKLVEGEERMERS